MKWSPLIIEEAIPMTMVLLLNGLVIIMLHGSSRRFTVMTKKQCKNQKKTTKILLATVTIYLMCHVPTIIFYLLYYLGSEDEKFREKWYLITPVKELALMINSSANFVIYCLVGSKLRGEFLRLFGLKPQTTQTQTERRLTVKSKY